MVKEKKLIPKIRFQGFAEEWEQNIVKNLCSISTGKSNTQDKEEEGKYPFYVRSPIIERSNDYLYNQEAVLTVGDGVGTGKVFHYVNGKYNLHQRVYRMFDFNQNILAKYFYNYFSKNFYKRVMSMTAKTSVDSVRMEMIADMQIVFPNIREQKIVDFFNKLDTVIELQKREIENYKKYKKAMLQKMFPKKGEKTPELRFQGFTDDWEEKKLGKLANVYDGTHQTPKYTSEGVMFLSVEDIKTLESEKYISNEDFKKDFKVYPQKNDILMTRIGDVGTSNIVEEDKKIAYYVSLALLKPQNIKSGFLNTAISSFHVQDEIWRRTLHIAFPKKINKNEIEKINIIYPKYEEQEKIGSFFQQLDNIIEKEEKKLEHYQKLKRAMLQKMFV